MELHSLTAANPAKFETAFYQQGVKILSASSGLGSFLNNSFDAMLHGRQGYTISCRHIGQAALIYEQIVQVLLLCGHYHPET